MFARQNGSPRALQKGKPIFCSQLMRILGKTTTVISNGTLIELKLAQAYKKRDFSFHKHIKPRNSQHTWKSYQVQTQFNGMRILATSTQTWVTSFPYYARYENITSRLNGANGNLCSFKSRWFENVINLNWHTSLCQRFTTSINIILRMAETSCVQTSCLTHHVLAYS